MEVFFTYIIQSETSGRYYIGSTQNIEERLKRHNTGRSTYTKNKGPWKLVYNEGYKTRSEALKREYYLKSLKSRTRIEKLIKSAMAPSSSGLGQ